MSQSEHASKLIRPMPHEATKPICIRVFLNDDNTQYAAELVAVWGASPPGAATTVHDEPEWHECGECGHYEARGRQVGQRWRLDFVHDLPVGDGVVGFYRKVSA